MTRTHRRLALGLLIATLTLVGMNLDRSAIAAESALPPERTFSNSPFIHRIILRDEDGNIISGPPKPTADGKAVEDPGGKAMSQYTTCGKCHSDKDLMYTGWHSNASDPHANKGRPGEPWILADVQTRTQLPLSFRKWAGTYDPHDVGLNDFKFAMSFGRHLPGGDAVAKSDDLRFKMSGKFELDCLICHTTDSGYDPVDRAAQLGEDFQNFKWASNHAAGIGRVVGTAAKLKDNWDPSDPNARPAPKIAYKADRFDTENRVLFNLSRRVTNDRCYFCHTSVSGGPVESVADEHAAKPATQGAAPVPAKGGVAFRQSLEGRWRHDRDIHLAKGMLCVDCHRNGADHMTTRGYEGEYADRESASKAEIALRQKELADAGTEAKAVAAARERLRMAEARRPDKSIATLSCVGCHYGAEGTPGAANPPMVADAGHGATNLLGGRNAAPRPAHKGLPTLHFDKISCTTCHSGPYPTNAATMVQTSLAHRLGLPHHRHSDDAAPLIQQPVFLRVDPSGKQVADDVLDGKITPHKVLFPSFWGRLNGDTITPMTPELVIAAVGKSLSNKLFDQAPDSKEVEEALPLEPAKIVQALDKIAAYEAPKPDAPKSAAAQAATTPSAATQPATPRYLTGEPVFITGGKAYRSKGGKLEAFDHPAAKPYAWAMAHDVRGAQQSLGARGCTDCHASGAPLFDSVVSSVSLIPAASVTKPMHEVRGDSMGALTAFATTYPMRPILIFTGYACAGVLALVLLNYGTRAVSRIGRGRS